MIDTSPHLNELDEEDVVPSVVIGDLYKEVSVEETIAAGDIGGILEVLEKAVGVQNEKIPEQPNAEDYADAFTGMAYTRGGPRVPVAERLREVGTLQLL